MTKIKLGVLGAGHLGKIHIRLAKELDSEFELAGFHDPNEEISKAAAEEFGLEAFDSIEDLVDRCDAIDIVTPTLSHFNCAQYALRSGKHVFIEKPLTNTMEEAKKLVDLTEEAKLSVQVGHVERFNPAFVAAQPHFDQVMFIETHRLAEYNPRGTDVSVVLDLMIHDIDIVLNVVKSNLRKTSASGVAVISDNPDICNARLEFDNGCVANLTASRISLKNMRKSRFFQKNAYITVDFLERKTDLIQIQDPDPTDPFGVIINPGNDKKPKQLVFDKPTVLESNAIKEELRAFAHAINNSTPTKVTVEDGHDAMQVAYQILDQLSFSNSIFAA
jgi:predicted dehydrogenase